MTPRLQQAIALLQLSTLELNTYIDQQLLENPLLQQDMEEPIDTREDSLESTNTNESEESSIYDIHSSSNFDSDTIEPLWKSHKTLGEYIIEQIHHSFQGEVERLIAFELMLHLDEDGFLDSEWVNVAKTLQLDEAQVEEVIQVMQTFDPPGIFARSVIESLKIQLLEKNKFASEQVDIMLEAFQEIGSGDFAKIAKKAHIDKEIFQDFLNQLRFLQFRPAHAFSQNNDLTTITPDVYVRTELDGTFKVQLNFNNQPRVLVNSQYYHDLKGKISRSEELSYLKEKFASANWLIQSLQKRAATLLQVASEIVNWQQDYFASNSHPLKPMTLKDIAEAANVHESTVSRITTAKYLQTPRGLFELKSFFVSSVGVKTNQANTSSDQIQNVLKKIIQEEPKNSPLSDEDLVQILQSKGLAVARRTISKYRTLLGIASSRDRKKHYAMKIRM